MNIWKNAFQQLPPLLLAGLAILIVVTLIRPGALEHLPGLIWALAGGWLLWFLREPIRGAVQRTRSFKGGGIEIELAEQALNEAMVGRDLDPTEPKPAQARQALADEMAVLRGAEILWVDDLPANNRHEARTLQYAGAAVTCAASSDEARSALEEAAIGIGFDLIISDMSRGDDPRAGLAFLEELRRRSPAPPLIFYVGQAEGQAPPGASAITDRPDTLIRAVLSALRGRRSQ